MFYIRVDNEIELHLVQEHHHQTISDLLDQNREFLNEHIGDVDRTSDEVHQRCLRSKELFARNGTLITLIIFQGQAIGSINLHNRTGGTVSGLEIGYWLAQDFKVGVL